MGCLAKRSWWTRRFGLYALGNSINNVGNAFYLIVLPLVVYQTTRSSFAMAGTVGVEALSTLLLPLWGLLADRMRPRALMVRALVFQAAVSMVLPLGLHSAWLTLPALYAVSFLVGVGANALQTVQTRVVPLMFPDSARHASAGLTSAYTLTTIVGPVLAAAALAHDASGLLLWANSASFLGPILLIPWTHIPNGPLPVRAGRVPVHQALAEGFTVLKAHRTLRPLLGVLVAVDMSYAVATVLTVYRAKSAFHWPDAAVSALFLASGLGALLGTRLPLWVRARGSGWLPALLALNLVGLAGLVTPWAPALPLGLGCVAAAYLALAVERNLRLQQDFPVSVLGRVNTSVRTLTGLGALVATVGVGAVSAYWGVIAAVGVLFLIGALPLAALGPIQALRDRWDSHRGRAQRQ